MRAELLPMVTMAMVVRVVIVAVVVVVVSNSNSRGKSNTPGAYFILATPRVKTYLSVLQPQTNERTTVFPPHYEFDSCQATCSILE